MAIDKNSTGYTITFAVIMVVVVAALLGGLSVSLKDLQKANVDNENRIFILAASGAFTVEEGKSKSKEEISKLYDESVTGGVIDFKGNDIEGEEAFKIDIVKEYKATKNTPEDRKYPFFTYSSGGTKRYVIPMAGNGLWGPVWGYICLDSDQNSVVGVVFDHKSETPGLGAEITKEKFTSKFLGKKVINGAKYEGISVVKGVVKKPNHQVDAIAGATITSKGVGAMLLDGFAPYMLAWKGIEK